MILIKFKNLEKSEIVRQAVEERVEALVIKFPDLQAGRIQVTLEMENSPRQAGLDVFKVRLHVLNGRYRGASVEKANSNFYVALAEVVDHMLERFNRFGDRARVKERNKARRILRTTEEQLRRNQLGAA